MIQLSKLVHRTRGFNACGKEILFKLSRCNTFVNNRKPILLRYIAGLDKWKFPSFNGRSRERWPPYQLGGNTVRPRSQSSLTVPEESLATARINRWKATTGRVGKRACTLRRYIAASRSKLSPISYPILCSFLTHCFPTAACTDT